MNRFGLNRGAINGAAGSVVTLASAIILGSASVSADTSRLFYAQVAGGGSCTASVTATAIRYAVVEASPAAVSHNYASANVIWAGVADVDASATVTAFTIRLVDAEAEIDAEASVTAYPAALIGDAPVIATASVTADATYIYRLAAWSTPISCSAQLSGLDPQVTRSGIASIDAPGRLRAEATYRESPNAFDYLDGWAYPTGECTVTISGDDTLWQPGPTHISVSSDVAASATLIQNAGHANATGTAVFSFGPVRILPTEADAFGSANCTATATRKTFSGVAITASCQLVADPRSLQNAYVAVSAAASGSANAAVIHRSVDAELFCSATIAPIESVISQLPTTFLSGRVTLEASANQTHSAHSGGFLQPQLFVNADGDVLVDSEGNAIFYETAYVVQDIGGRASVAANAYRETYADTDAVGGASVTAVSLRRIHPNAQITASASISSSASYIYSGSCVVSANAVVVASGQRFQGSVVEIFGTASIEADTVTNPYSLDPDWRTFRRPGVEVFRRPSAEVEFRRAA